jgi:hypothetical protein
MATPDDYFSNMRNTKWFCFLLLMLFQSFAISATFGIRKDGKLDQAAIAKGFKDSDWDEVRNTLESYLRRNGDSRVAVEERIFAYKYLGVIFAADSVTRTRAESYFNRLLDLSPTIEIVDMYASKKISDFFHEVKREYENQKSYANQHDAYGRKNKELVSGKSLDSNSDQGQDSMPTLGGSSHPPQPIPRRKGAELENPNGSSWVWWTVGIAAVTGVGASVFYLTQDKAPERQVEVTKITPTRPVP